MLTLLDLIWADFRLLRETGSELLDRSLPPEKQQQIKAILATYEPQGIQFHALRTRVAASQQFVTFHVLVPGSWTVQQGHQLCEENQKLRCKQTEYETALFY